jgi:beta-phosphoglucomutase-like phosphatase (HAD superfamily)
VKLVISDFDGTLFDSCKLIIESHRVVFGEFGFALPSEFCIGLLTWGPSFNQRWLRVILERVYP